MPSGRALEYELSLRQACRSLQRARNMAVEIGNEGEAEDLLAMWEHAHYLYLMALGHNGAEPLKGQLRLPLR